MRTSVFLKPNREKSLKAHHPWVYTGALDLERLKAEPAPGEIVTLRTSDGGFLAHAGWSAASQLRARVWTFHESEAVDNTLIERRMDAALTFRTQMGFAARDGFRWVHGESDALPGLVVDVYGEVIVFSISAAAMEPFRPFLIEYLRRSFGQHGRKSRTIVERSDADVRTYEGLEPRVEIVFGNLDDKAIITEHGLQYEIDVLTGHKTGYYLDQSDNRAQMQTLAAGKRVLNCFCYTGGFSMAALKGGAAHVVSVDASAEALATAKRQITLNDLDASRCVWDEADVFEYLRKKRDAGAQYDVIVLDPPKFAPSAAHAEKAARAYKDINLWAMKLLAPSGTLLTYSCSGGIDDALFQKIVAGAAIDAHAEMKIVKKLQASADHPIATNFPEGHYLKGLMLVKT
jgi:23S rRNA (cytosine1962-C5)-methyltransferase